jgi:hypothetical protein
MVRPSVGRLETAEECPPVCPELKISEAPGVLPTNNQYAVALPGVQVKVTADDRSGHAESGLIISPIVLAGGGAGAWGGVGPTLKA